MAVIDLYSKRRKRARGEIPDVYTYDEIPAGLRTQIVQIWSDVIGVPRLISDYDVRSRVEEVYQAVASTLRREYCVFSLSEKRIDPHDESDAITDFIPWFLGEKNTDRVIDAIELTGRAIEAVCSKTWYQGRSTAQAKATVTEALEEINVRFKEHGIGYQYSDGQMVRVDSQLIHTEAVVPALAVLRAPEFENAQDEFLSAYEHYRHGKKQEALVDCYKCFESTMKVICDKRGWSYDATKASAADLVKICFDNGLIPAYWQTHLGGLRSVLESAISTPRNRQAGHGAGVGVAPELPAELVSYVLHMTAATVLFLAEAEKRLP